MNVDKAVRHLEWIQAIKMAKKRAEINMIVDEIRAEGYEEKRAAALEKLQTKNKPE